MKVALASDGSAHAEAALQLLLSISWRETVTFDVLTVADKHAGLGHLDERQAQALAQQVGDEVKKHVDPKDTVATHVLSGHPAHVISNYIKTNQVELLVVGAHSKHGALNEMILGSVVDQVLRDTDTSILIGAKGEQPPAAPNKVVLAVGSEETSQVVIDALSRFDWSKRSPEFMVLHGYEPPMSDYTPSAQRDAMLFKEAREQARNDCGVYVTGLAEALDKTIPGSSVHTTCIEDFTVAPSIVRLSKNWQADLIVLGPKQHTGMDEFLVGSVSRQVAKSAPCAVLVARSAMKAG